MESNKAKRNNRTDSFRNKQNAKHIVLSVTNSQVNSIGKVFLISRYSKDVTTYKIIKRVR